MKRIYQILVFVVLGGGLLLFFGVSDRLLPHSYAKITGSPGGNTGSPMDARTCTQCHTGAASVGSINISMLDFIDSSVVTQYISGRNYLISVEHSSSVGTLNGFELTAEKGNNKVGSFAASDGSTKPVYVGTTITHTNASSQNKWFMKWSAPSSPGTGAIRFYASFLEGNGDNTANGDVVFTANKTVTEEITSVGERYTYGVKVYPSIAKVGQDIFISSKDQGSIKSIIVYSVSGKEVMRSFGEATSIQIIKAGTYILKIQTSDDKMAIEKIIVQ